MVIQNWRKVKKGFLAKKMPDTIYVEGEKKRAFSCTLSVWPKIVWGPKQCKPGKTIK